ncbi:hypothetical protein [Lentibacillus amyloliquefaciens]|uniref:hypothetical protein n=1 Tax=Lentibacillus amyloliquefaciens TaxID=1472767 RepID=UPI0012E3AE04|nr:hypothetical protein [Lentibacillus amyloliquefaciens]
MEKNMPSYGCFTLEESEGSENPNGKGTSLILVCEIPSFLNNIVRIVPTLALLGTFTTYILTATLPLKEPLLVLGLIKTSCHCDASLCWFKIEID